MPTKRILFSILMALAVFLAFNTSIKAEDLVVDLQKQIEEYSQKILDLSKAKDTLQNQVSYLTSQINLTQLKIQQTQNNIITLENEIHKLGQKIDLLDLSLNKLSVVYIENVNNNYKLGKKTPALFYLISDNFGQFLNQFKYLKSVQENNRNLLIELETTRTNYDIQKQQKADKQTELAVLKDKLSAQQIDLAKQKTAKSDLLVVTQNDEKKYQQLKSEAERELNSLLTAKFVGKRQVSKDEALGLMGNTGYSFGAHLHFGLYNLTESELSSWSYFNDIDASGYLSEHIWPMSDPIKITQDRGVTQYAYLYSDRFHHGIDMVSTNKTINAINEGVAYFYRNAESSLGNHVKLFHPDGKMTLYLHMQ